MSSAEWEHSSQNKSFVTSTIECGIACYKTNKENNSCNSIYFDKTTSLCYKAKLIHAPARDSGLRVAWSSSTIHTRHAGFTMDKITTQFGSTNIFASKNDKFPWLAVDLLVPHEVTGVQMVERKDCCAQRTNNIEMRVGYVKPFESGNGEMIYTSNEICGMFVGPGVVGKISPISCTSPLVRRFVTLQWISGGTATSLVINHAYIN